MKIKPAVEKAINEQINAELYSAYLYLSMASYFESQNLKGFAHWMQVQAKEEMSHAMKMYGFVFERGGKVALKAIEQPPSSWKSALNVFENVYEHEQKVTDLISKLVDVARSENDVASENFLMWFIDEQVEEEAHSSQAVEKLKMIGDARQALYMLDREMGARE
jgi:ferritin